MEAGRWKPEGGSRMVEAGWWKPDGGSWKVEAGRWKPEGGSRMVEAGRWKLEGGADGEDYIRSENILPNQYFWLRMQDFTALSQLILKIPLLISSLQFVSSTVSLSLKPWTN